MNSDDPLNFPHKPVEDGFGFDVETDSLADTMGLRLPNRSLYVLQGVVVEYLVSEFMTNIMYLCLSTLLRLGEQICLMNISLLLVHALS